MKATSFSYFLKYALLVKLIQTNHCKSVLYNPNHYCQYLTFITIIRPADTDVFLVVASLLKVTQVTFWVETSDNRKYVCVCRLCLTLIMINKSVGLTQTG